MSLKGSCIGFIILLYIYCMPLLHGVYCLLLNAQQFKIIFGLIILQPESYNAISITADIQFFLQNRKILNKSDILFCTEDFLYFKIIFYRYIRSLVFSVLDTLPNLVQYFKSDLEVKQKVRISLPWSLTCQPHWGHHAVGFPLKLIS